MGVLCQPLAHLCKDLRLPEQLQMARIVTNALPFWRNAEGQARVGVLSERAVQRHKTVAQQRALEIRRAFAKHGRGRITLDACRQGQWLAGIASPRKPVRTGPVFIAQIAVAQVGDPSAAGLAQVRDRRQPRRGSQKDVDLVAAPLQR